MNIFKKYKIELTYSLKKYYPLFLRNKKDLNKILKEVLKEINRTRISVGVHLINEKEMKKLNKETRKIDESTDVLSYPMLENMEGLFYLGDIFLNVNLIKKQALEIKSDQNTEIKFLFMHGLLHLIGYDHMSQPEEKEMLDRQKEIFIKLGIREW